MYIKPLKYVLNTTLIIASLPHLVYAFACVRGTISTEASWNAHGGNYGPWAWTNYEWFFYLPLALLLLVLPLVSFWTGLCVSVAAKRARFFGLGLMLIVLQFALAIVQFLQLFWLVNC